MKQKQKETSIFLPKLSVYLHEAASLQSSRREEETHEFVIGQRHYRHLRFK